MAIYLKKFETQAAYEAAQSGLILPNVSLIVETNGVAYNPYVPSFFCKLILNNGETVELEGSGELTSTMISPYISTCVSVEIGKLCTSIGGSAFQSCKSLTSIDIPNSVTIIGSGAFLSCSGLISCTIGNGVTSIGVEAFYWCSSLTSATVNATTPPTLSGGAFDSTNNCPIYVPSGSVEAYKSATNWSTYASRIQAIP